MFIVQLPTHLPMSIHDSTIFRARTWAVLQTLWTWSMTSRPTALQACAIRTATGKNTSMKYFVTKSEKNFGLLGRWFLIRPNHGLFSFISSFSYSNNNFNNKCRWSVWDSSPWPLDGWRSRNHGVKAAAPIRSLVCFNISPLKMPHRRHRVIIVTDDARDQR